MIERIFTPSRSKDDVEFDNALRPKSFNEFIGQEDLKSNLSVFIQSAKIRDESLDHILLFGPPGLGKTTLAYIIAHELDVDIKITSGPILDKPADLAGILTNLKKGDILFIDEIHRMNRTVEEYLYPAMENFLLDIMIDNGPGEKSVRIPLKPFTLIGATTRTGLLSSPMRSRFGFTSRLNFYGEDDILEIIKRSAKILKAKYKEDGLLEIARRSRGTPRIANRLLKRVRDYAIVKGEGVIDKAIATHALEKLKIDEEGLDDVDREILLTIIRKYNGGPVGLKTIAASIGEEQDTIEDVYEPYLLMKGFIKRTPRGREVTELAFKHLDIAYNGFNKQEEMF
ncbi:Holliday junction branch migration DNA helicase RuvB [candidate division TA06 bacterium]|uniref:Holliday junction branch migration complex subunit RuvB n=1 Tax=candidate division TA06 bacterium TaxID=2250710 RepID=A0A660SB66_UNCT6|nr:MAG: Holliday junction branch migration DNA helicase RuvB [candidate division TA06 bacterium]